MPYPRARPAQGDRDGDASPPVNPAVTFDLFGTLVHLDERRLPRVRVDGVPVPSLLGAVFGVLRNRVPSVDLARALVAYFESGTDLVERHRADPDREFGPDEHMARWLERIGIEDPWLIDDLSGAQLVATLRAAHVEDGTLEMFEALRARGYRLGLISNAADARAGRAVLSQLGLGPYFDAVVFSGDVGWRKPDRRIFERALAALHATADTAVHVGDELRADIWGAGRCGVNAVWINSSAATFAGDYAPMLTIPSVRYLKDSDLATYRLR